jgi:hypothetical protein
MLGKSNQTLKEFGSHPEFIEKAGKIIRQTRGGGIKIPVSLLECSRFHTKITDNCF